MYQNKCGEFVVGYCVVKADVHPLCFAVVVIVLRLPYCPFQQSDWLTAVISKGFKSYIQADCSGLEIIFG